MDSGYKTFIESGRRILTDTQQPRRAEAKKKIEKKDIPGLGEGESDPHKRFIKRCIKEKPKKKEILEMFQVWIQQAEAEL